MHRQYCYQQGTQSVQSFTKTHINITDAHKTASKWILLQSDGRLVHIHNRMQFQHPSSVSLGDSEGPKIGGGVSLDTRWQKKF